MTELSLIHIFTATLKKIIPTSLGILFLIVMSQVLKGSGIMQLIAQGVTQLTGKYYSFAVPFLGLLGAFVTSSNTSSNILLGSFQKTAADMISVNEAAILAAPVSYTHLTQDVSPAFYRNRNEKYGKIQTNRRKKNTYIKF